MLKLGCTLPNLANICLHKSTDAKFYPFTEGEKDLLEKLQEDVVDGPSIAFTRKAVVDETFSRKSLNICKSFVVCWNWCQPTISILDVSTHAHRSLYALGFRFRNGRFTPRQNKIRSFENMVMSYFQQTRPECEIESSFTTGRQKKIDCFSDDGFCSHCNTVFEAMCCHSCPCQELRPSLTEKDIQRGSKKRELDALRRHYIQEKGIKVIEMWECEWWRLHKITNTVKQHIREHFPYKLSNFWKR